MSAVPAQSLASTGSPGADERPRLLIFASQRSGPCRRVEGFLAQVLQRGRNHKTFRVTQVSVDERPDLADRFRVAEVPTFLVVEGTKITRRIVNPRGCAELSRELAPWLR